MTCEHLQNLESFAHFLSHLLALYTMHEGSGKIVHLHMASLYAYSFSPLYCTEQIRLIADAQCMLVLEVIISQTVCHSYHVEFLFARHINNLVQNAQF